MEYMMGKFENRVGQNPTRKNSKTKDNPNGTD